MSAGRPHEPLKHRPRLRIVCRAHAPTETAVATLSSTDIVEALGPFVSEARRARIEEVLRARLGRLTVVVEDVYDPHNVAAALRTCEALGIGILHVIEGNHRFRFSDKVTQGAHDWVDVLKYHDARTAISALHAQGFQLFGAAPDGTLELNAIPINQPLALVFGNEHQGLSAEMRNQLNGVFRIPMAGFTRSLNLSVAVAIATFDVTRRLRTTLGTAGDLDAATQMELRARWFQQSVRGADAIVRRFKSSQA